MASEQGGERAELLALLRAGLRPDGQLDAGVLLSSRGLALGAKELLRHLSLPEYDIVAAGCPEGGALAAAVLNELEHNHWPRKGLVLLRHPEMHLIGPSRAGAVTHAGIAGADVRPHVALVGAVARTGAGFLALASRLRHAGYTVVKAVVLVEQAPQAEMIEAGTAPPVLTERQTARQVLEAARIPLVAAFRWEEIAMEGNA